MALKTAIGEDWQNVVTITNRRIRGSSEAATEYQTGECERDQFCPCAHFCRHLLKRVAIEVAEARSDRSIKFSRSRGFSPVGCFGAVPHRWYKERPGCVAT